MKELTSFCERWIAKSNGYNEENTEEVFDKFFSLFVTYNAIYFNATLYLIKHGRIGKKRTGDKVSATNNMSDFIGTNELYAKLISLKSDVEAIIAEVEDNRFYISTEKDNITPNKAEDLRLGEKIKNKFNLTNAKEKRKFNIALLTLIYGVRCNMFHGKKGIDPLQKDILNPMNNILKTIIDDLIERDKLSLISR